MVATKDKAKGNLVMIVCKDCENYLVVSVEEMLERTLDELGVKYEKRLNI